MPNFITRRVGGVEIQTYFLAKHLVEIGWRVHFIAESTTTAGFEEVCEGIQVRWIPRRGLFSSGGAIMPLRFVLLFRKSYIKG